MRRWGEKKNKKKPHTCFVSKQNDRITQRFKCDFNFNGERCCVGMYIGSVFVKETKVSMVTLENLWPSGPPSEYVGPIGPLVKVGI